MKYWEGPWYDYRTNECGYRSSHSCRPAPPGTLRIAMIGSSIGNGFAVAYPDSLAARSEAALGRACRRGVEVQNATLTGAGIAGWPQWHRLLDRLPDVLRLRPAVVVMTISAMDLQYYARPLAESRQMAVPTSNGADGGATAAAPELPLVATAKRVVAGYPLVQVPRAWMFRNQSLYLDRFLENPDTAGYLFRTWPGIWRMRETVMAEVLGQIVARTRAAGVPILVVYVPTYPNAVAAHLAPQYPALDPGRFSESVRRVVAGHGGLFADATPAIAGHPGMTDLFYVGNVHPNAAGHAVIAAEVDRALARLVPAFAGCRVA